MLLKNICGKLQTGMRGEEKPDAAFLPGQKGSHPPLLPEQHIGCQRENKKKQQSCRMMPILIIVLLLNLSIASDHHDDDKDLSNPPLSMRTSAKRRESWCECRTAACKHNRYHQYHDGGNKEEEMRTKHHLQY